MSKEEKPVEITVMVAKPPVKITLPVNGKMCTIDMSEEDAKKLRNALNKQYPDNSLAPLALPVMYQPDPYMLHKMRQEVDYAEQRGYQRGYHRGYEEVCRSYCGPLPGPCRCR